MKTQRSPRERTLEIFVLLVGAVVIGRLFFLQVIDSDYKVYANNNALRHQILHPPRGEVYDRNGEFLVQSKESYDLLATPRDVEPFDTVKFAEILGVTAIDVRRELQKASAYSRRRPSVIFRQLPKEVKLKLDEKRFAGFYTQYRTVRTYPRKIAGNLLGYVGEVGDRQIKSDPYYQMGDYIGISGMEQAYEEVLRGRKGVRVELVDVFGMPQGSYQDGIHDTLPEPGKGIVATIDAGLQELAEYLLEGKIGSVVAIEPATGEILVMASSPSYDPDLLVGRDRNKNFVSMISDKRKPLFNRAVMSRYPPGSTFKIVNGMIGLEMGVARHTDLHSCNSGYPVGRGVKCHAHGSPLNMIAATQTSCNAYFCYVMRDILDKRGSKLADNYDRWYEMVKSFGFGRKLGSDFINEESGYVPTSDLYNRKYRSRWNSLTVISLAIGQGELGCTPLQMANLAATVANKGYYYIPHVVKSIDGGSIDSKFSEKQYTLVDPKHFEPIVEGMYGAVNIGGTSTSARIEGYDVCGKTGTAQNPNGQDHSVFISFAPKNNPKIAIAVFIEHGKWGATSALPIASLITEQYLTDTIKRTYLVDHIRNMDIAYPMYDRKQ